MWRCDGKCGRRFVFRWLASLVCAGVLPCVTGGVYAQTATVSAEVSSLGSRAETVFLGQVTAVRLGGRMPSSAGQGLAPAAAAKVGAAPPPGVVLVEFRVDAVLKGSAGATYTLREWSGLWPGGTARYWVGERAVMFVSAASGAGFAGPVDGMEGVVPVGGFDEGQPVLDLTRLRSSLLRAVGAPMADAGAHLSLGEVEALVEPPPVATPPQPVEWQPNPGRLPIATPSEPAAPVLPTRSLPVVNRKPQSLTMRSLPRPEVE